MPAYPLTHQQVLKEINGGLEPHLRLKGFVIDARVRGQSVEAVKTLPPSTPAERRRDIEQGIVRALKGGVTRFMLLYYETDDTVWLNTIRLHLRSRLILSILLSFANIPGADPTHLAMGVCAASKAQPQQEARIHASVIDLTLRWLSDTIFGKDHRALQTPPPPVTLTHRRWLQNMMDSYSAGEAPDTVEMKWIQPADKGETQHKYTAFAHTKLTLREKATVSRTELRDHLDHVVFHSIKSPTYNFEAIPLDIPRPIVTIKKYDRTKLAWAGDATFYDVSWKGFERAVPNAPVLFKLDAEHALSNNRSMATMPDSVGHFHESGVVEEHDAGTDWELQNSVGFGLGFEDDPERYEGWWDGAYVPIVGRAWEEWNALSNGGTEVEEDSKEYSELKRAREDESKDNRTSTQAEAPPVDHKSTIDISRLPKDIQEYYDCDPEAILALGNTDTKNGLWDHRTHVIVASGSFDRFYGSPGKTQAEKRIELASQRKTRKLKIKGKRNTAKPGENNATPRPSAAASSTMPHSGMVLATRKFNLPSSRSHAPMAPAGSSSGYSSTALSLAICSSSCGLESCCGRPSTKVPKVSALTDISRSRAHPAITASTSEGKAHTIGSNDRSPARTGHDLHKSFQGGLRRSRT